MIAGVRGRLISTTFADTELHQLPGAGSPPAAFTAALAAWSDRRHSRLGPSSSLRAISDGAVIPLLQLLGYEVAGRVDRSGRTMLQAVAGLSTALPVAITAWNEPLDDLWRDIVREGIRADARWGICCNGSALRIVDAHRTWARAYVEFDLTLVANEPVAVSVLWSVLRAEAMASHPSFLERAAEGSARHGVGVCKALGEGVLNALGLLFGALSRRPSDEEPKVLFEQSLTVLYRVLFLLFAEARGLVPIWHPIYRDRYTIDAIVTTLMAGRSYRGIWDAVLSISRLAHAGCRAGELNVTAFNGRLFSPAHSSLFDRRRINDAIMGEAVLAVGVDGTSGAGPRRILYSDLDVEQLGAVYERVLEYEPTGDQPTLTRARDTRQSSGSFYTPRTLTAVLVRQTLEPLVRSRTARDILELRVVDPAMGSGAFLVAACRYLARAAEEKLIQEGSWHAGDVTAAERAALRRDIAQRCLFGVDLNPMAVQLARLSLWLATLASDKPLTFLDHHLVAGDSLIGASLEDR
jgi:hypothetical protein